MLAGEAPTCGSHSATWQSLSNMAVTQQHGSHSATWQSLGNMAVTRQHGSHSATWQSLGYMAVTRLHGSHSATWQSLSNMAVTQQHGSHSATWQSFSNMAVTRQHGSHSATWQSSSSSSSIGVQELLPIPPTVIRPGLGACNRCNGSHSAAILATHWGRHAGRVRPSIGWEVKGECCNGLVQGG